MVSVVYRLITERSSKLLIADHETSFAESKLEIIALCGGPCFLLPRAMKAAYCVSDNGILFKQFKHKFVRYKNSYVTKTITLCEVKGPFKSE